MPFQLVSSGRGLIAALSAVTLVLGTALGVSAAVPGVSGDGQSIGRTPPRLSYVVGQASFWRPGAPDWTPAQLNTPLAPGDELYTGEAGNLELQVGTRAFVRAWGETQLGLANQEPDFLQLKVTSGHVSLDLRSLDPGRTVELDTPSAVFTIDHPGYYRVDVSPERTSFITRRAGRAVMTPAGGQAVAITPSEEVVLDNTATPTVQSYVAPELDPWDRWNYARTDELLEALSARYVSADVYGANDLDHYGNWRVVPTYGPVWVPEAVPDGWAPYSAGRWMRDAYYGWTWVDTAPWGWAPYHYGRWVSVDGFWAWAPGPVVARAAYAPALVAFFNVAAGGGVIEAPSVGWVALSWGEPVVPWWGSAGFIGRPWWGGWAGPHVVNDAAVKETTISIYRNVNVPHAVVAVRQDSFGPGAVHEERIANVDAHRLVPVRGGLKVRPEAANAVAASQPGPRPPQATFSRPVVATRPPAGQRPAPRPEESSAASTMTAPSPKIVSAPTPAPAATPRPRPAFGTSSLERSRPPAPPHFETKQSAAAPPPAHRDGEHGTAERRTLPGEPANRLSPGRADQEHRSEAGGSNDHSHR